MTNEYAGFEEVKDGSIGTFEDAPNAQNDEALGWEDEIEKESEFIMLEPGDYQFTVVDLERSRYRGGEKMGPCPMAIVHLKFVTKQGEITLKHNLYLHKKCEGLLGQFFLGVGLKKHGEKLKMEWNKVVGRSGWAKIGRRTYNGNEYNDIKRILEPRASKSAPTATSFEDGKF